jgi:hypothetical protein
MILQGVSKSKIKSYEFLDMPETVLGKTRPGKGQNRYWQNGWCCSMLLDGSGSTKQHTLTEWLVLLDAARRKQQHKAAL